MAAPAMTLSAQGLEMMKFMVGKVTIGLTAEMGMIQFLGRKVMIIFMQVKDLMF